MQDYTSVLLSQAAANADRVSGVAAPRKTPYTREPGGAQVTAFGFRRRVLPSTSAPPPVAIAGTGRCSPHLPPTPPTTHVPVVEAGKSNVPRANRFGFQLSPRCTAVLNNINAQLVANGSMDPNCNPLPDESEATTITPEPSTQLTNGNIEQFKNPSTPTSMLPKPKVKPESRLLSKLPAPKSLLKPRAQSASNKSNIVKPVVAKPVIRPANTKSAKTEANRMVALQSSDSSPSSVISSGCGTLSTESSHMSRPRTLDMVLGPRGCFDVRDVTRPATAPVAKPEDLDEEEQEEKACIDESLSEKPTEAWTETVPDEMSSSSNSYSEGIEEQQIEFPDNLTDKSADSLFSSCSSASSASSSDEPPAKLAEKKKSSSGASLSQLSDGSSEQRDFLIDDEIADQPGLTFMAEEGGYMGDDGEYMSEAEDARQANFTADNTDNAEETTFNGDETYVTEDSQQPEMSTLIHEPPSIQGGGEEGGVEAQASPMRTPVSVRRHRRRSASTGTLSPCESITSDDLMLDFDESAVDSTPSRLAKSSQQLAELTSEMSGSEEILKEWSLMLGSATSLNNMGSARPAPQLRSRASSGSDVQLVSSRMVRGSPLRPPRSANSGGPVLDAEEGFVRLEWSAYQSMLQDIVTFKTNLLKLKRLLLEAEVRNPFDTSLKQNGLYYSLAHSEDKRDTEEEPTPQEQLADLRRQVVFLQQQMGDKDRTISLLQQQMSKYCTNTTGDSSDSSSTSNAATQTERVRPVSSGAAISQSYPSEGGPLVSSSEQVRQPRSATRPAIRKSASSKTTSALPRRTASVVTKPN